MSRGGSDSPALRTRRWTRLSSVLLSTRYQAHEDSQESLTSLPRRDTMGSYLPDSSSYELLTVIGTSLKTHPETQKDPRRRVDLGGVPSVF